MLTRILHEGERLSCGDCSHKFAILSYRKLFDLEVETVAVFSDISLMWSHLFVKNNVFLLI